MRWASSAIVGLGRTVLRTICGPLATHGRCVRDWLDLASRRVGAWHEPRPRLSSRRAQRSRRPCRGSRAGPSNARPAYDPNRATSPRPRRHRRQRRRLHGPLPRSGRPRQARGRRISRRQQLARLGLPVGSQGEGHALCAARRAMSANTCPPKMAVTLPLTMPSTARRELVGPRPASSIASSSATSTRIREVCTTERCAPLTNQRVRVPKRCTWRRTDGRSRRRVGLLAARRARNLGRLLLVGIIVHSVKD